LSEFRALVDVKRRPHAAAEPGDRTVVGLDVGSTTTKGVVVRLEDQAIVASDYLRTDGDPVGASRRVYASLAAQIAVPIHIEGLGVTGSGRQIAGLHAMTDGVINEIIAHATAAVHFDPEVDTIFEIGGQDAKYTYITNGVPSDYAMNEACSAGTGSFLEESAKESLGLDVTRIGPTAYEAQSPPNFNDQCAAFIGSDIKTAVQEGLSTCDIVAGLVYSVCMNYINRVKGNRPVGKKIFVQGGVCYNEAVPAALASLTGKRVVVPPDPGLMGAFGVALEVIDRIGHGLLERGSFDLAELAQREATHLEPFVCKGGNTDCDRKCEIARIRIAGKVYPFGGICNRFDNLVHHRTVDATALNGPARRQQEVFRDLAAEDPDDPRPTVGLNRSFLVNTYFPFYRRFFDELGFRAVLPDTIAPEGKDLQGAAFCFPVELAHGFAARLVARAPDYIFLPHVRSVQSGNGYEGPSYTCVFVQGEPYYLRTALPALATDRTLSPVLDLARGVDGNLAAFEQVGRALGAGAAEVRRALDAATSEQARLEATLRRLGEDSLAAVRQDPDRIGIVVFGRPYNAFAPEANKGIPAKLASRGVHVIPFDALPFEDEALEDDHNMYWALGRQILKAAHYVARDPQLFGAYITNFSCGPDSFVVGYFRDIMGRKPSLTLELDNHTADAGIETRLEAFLDIVSHYRAIQGPPDHHGADDGYTPAVMKFRGGKAGVRTSDGRWLPLEGGRVKVLLPAMGRYGTPLVAKGLECLGIRAETLPPADAEVLKLGRGHSSCKECLPLQTTIGSLLNYIAHRDPDEVTAYFMASAGGPCRFGQYHVFSKRTIEKNRFRNVAVISLTSLDSYGGFGSRLALTFLRGVIIGDLFDEMWSTILAAAADPEEGVAVLNREHRAVLDVIHQGWPATARQLSRSAKALGGIALERPYDEVPKVSLVGEIYVRNDPISLQHLVERLAGHGFAVRTAESTEWLRYVDWLAEQGIEGERSPGFWLRKQVKRYLDRRIRRRLAPSGLFFRESPDIRDIIGAAAAHLSPQLTGEAILTVGAAMHEILHPACGVIAIGPFGCMPTRVAESILTEKLSTTEKRALAKHNGHAGVLATDRKLPFLAIETDGNPFPQLVEARLEAFMLQAKRLHVAMREDR